MNVEWKKPNVWNLHETSEKGDFLPVRFSVQQTEKRTFIAQSAILSLRGAHGRKEAGDFRSKVLGLTGEFRGRAEHLRS